MFKDTYYIYTSIIFQYIILQLEAFSDKLYSDLLCSSFKTKCCTMMHCLMLAHITVFGTEMNASRQHTLKIIPNISILCHNKRQTSLQVN